MTLKRGKPWFAVKKFGYGVGLPIAWEGWMLSSAFVAAVALSGLLLPPLLSVLSVMSMTAGFVYVANLRSDDEWRYRSGE